MLKLFNILVLSVSLLIPLTAQGQQEWSGERIMEEVSKRHEIFPYVFEEQTIIRIDSRGKRDVQMARRFSRIEKEDSAKFLLVFDNPAEIRGVALLAIYSGTGPWESRVYLPAFGKKMVSITGEERKNLLLGTDFSIEDLMAEQPSNFIYTRSEDYKIDNTNYFVIEARPKSDEVRKVSSYKFRRHFIRDDIFFISRTDYYDKQGRFYKRQTNHDLKRVGKEMWRANTIIMENIRVRHSSLIKINNRIFSQDYVSPVIFTPDWLLANRHIKMMEEPSFRDTSLPDESVTDFKN
ncbi:MAG: outer membrane lipoprotein-sorting protein [Deltaproteobacteria bacterium]|nr:outer membrane lipoprotein-sorting protein [Deltaproteobacteria bacterium]